MLSIGNRTSKRSPEKSESVKSVFETITSISKINLKYDRWVNDFVALTSSKFFKKFKTLMRSVRGYKLSEMSEKNEQHEFNGYRFIKNKTVRSN